MSKNKKQPKPDLPMVPDRPKEKARIELLSQEDRVDKTYQEYAKNDFMCFCRGLTIKSDDGPKVFESCMAPFQRDFFEDIAPNLEALKKGDMPSVRRFWLERTKKGGKDSDVAICLLWCAAFAIRPFYMQVGAADKEQASIVKERITHLLEYNKWLLNYVELTKWVMKGKRLMSNGDPFVKLDIVSSDPIGIHGGTPDLMVINELSYIKRWEFAENLMNNADGVPRGIAIIATNAGFKGTKAEMWRNNAITSDMWSPHFLTRPAPWNTKENIDDAKRRIPHSAFLRLWRGIWVSGKGDAISEDKIEACFCLDGPTMEPEPGWIYVGGLDLGISHDHSGLVVLGIDELNQRLRVMWWKAWKPTNTGEVDLIDVESSCISAHDTYRLTNLFYDPFQAKLMAQRLKRMHVPVREMSFAKPSNLTAMATSFKQVIDSGKIECYDDADHRLRTDFGKFNIVEKTYGYKLEAVSDETGHADVATALVICLPYAVQMLEGVRGLRPEDDLVCEDDSDLTAEEIEAMPKDLREIYEMDAEHEEEYLLKKSRDPFEDIL